MAKFVGVIGFAKTEETSQDVFQEKIVEHGPYRGEITRESRALQSAENLNPNLSTQNMITITADAFASENFLAIRYIEWAGDVWTVAEATVQRPRLLLRLGGIYNGRRADPA